MEEQVGLFIKDCFPRTDIDVFCGLESWGRCGGLLLHGVGPLNRRQAGSHLDQS